jgi:putative membrane protein (TIGR04086 family)
MKTHSSQSQGRSHTKAFTAGIKSAAPRGLLPSCIRGLAAALLCLAIALPLTAGIVYSLSDPNRFVIPAALTALYVGCFFGGLIGARYNRGAPLVCGVLVSGMLLLVLFAASLILDPSLSADRPLSLSVGLRGIAVIMAILGALMGTKEKKRKKAIRKK